MVFAEVIKVRGVVGGSWQSMYAVGRSDNDSLSSSSHGIPDGAGRIESCLGRGYRGFKIENVVVLARDRPKRELLASPGFTVYLLHLRVTLPLSSLHTSGCNRSGE